jgi:hypothetical protein
MSRFPNPREALACSILRRRWSSSRICGSRSRPGDLVASACDPAGPGDPSCASPPPPAASPSALATAPQNNTSQRDLEHGSDRCFFLFKSLPAQWIVIYYKFIINSLQWRRVNIYIDKINCLINVFCLASGHDLFTQIWVHWPAGAATQSLEGQPQAAGHWCMLPHTYRILCKTNNILHISTAAQTQIV